MGQSFRASDQDFIRRVADLERRVNQLERMPSGLGSIGSQHLAHAAAGADEVDWSQMPAVLIASYNAHLAATSVAAAGFVMPFSGTKTAVPGSLGPVDVAGLLPPRAGYVRQYRIIAALTHVNAAGETAWWPVVSLEGTSLQIGPTSNANVSTHDEAIALAWTADAALDSTTVPVVLYLAVRTDYNGAVGTTYLRGAILEGRYVSA